MKLAYVDSCIWIARVEGQTIYRKIIDKKLNELAEEGWTFYSSEAVQFEVLIEPLKKQQDELVQIYRKIFDEIRMLKTYTSVFKNALLIAHTENLKGLDAVHVAIADHYNCKLFVSSDPHFRNLKTIRPFWINLEEKEDETQPSTL